MLRRILYLVTTALALVTLWRVVDCPCELGALGAPETCGCDRAEANGDRGRPAVVAQAAPSDRSTQSCCCHKVKPRQVSKGPRPHDGPGEQTGAMPPTPLEWAAVAVGSQATADLTRIETPEVLFQPATATPAPPQRARPPPKQPRYLTLRVLRI